MCGWKGVPLEMVNNKINKKFKDMASDSAANHIYAICSDQAVAIHTS